MPQKDISSPFLARGHSPFLTAMPQWLGQWVTSSCGTAGPHCSRNYAELCILLSWKYLKATSIADHLLGNLAENASWSHIFFLPAATWCFLSQSISSSILGLSCRQSLSGFARKSIKLDFSIHLLHFLFCHFGLFNQLTVAFADRLAIFGFLLLTLSIKNDILYLTFRTR